MQSEPLELGRTSQDVRFFGCATGTHAAPAGGVLTPPD